MKRLTLLSVSIVLLTNLIYSQSIDVKNSSANTLIQINDEGTTGSITLPSGSAPGTPDSKLYNEGGTLKWDGSALELCECDITRSEYDALVARVAALEGCIPESEVCFDGLDNDCDGLIDSNDPDCPPG